MKVPWPFGLPQNQIRPERLAMNNDKERDLQHEAPQILLVDDEEDILPEYQDFLELEGLESAICADPQKAVEMVLAQSDLRVVVTDLRMAQLDGAGLIRALRSALPAARRVDFIILTGDAALQTSDDIADVPVFIKPADTDALVAAIRSALASNQ